jgi:SNARE protein
LISDPNERSYALDQAEERLKGALGTKRSFKMETRLVQDIKERRKLEKRLHKLDKELKALKADLKALQAEENRGDLFSAAGRGGGRHTEEDAQKAGSNMLKEAETLQDKTQDSLNNTKQLIAQSKEVGVSTLEELQRQREVIENIDREADRMDDNLKRAEALLKVFGKRMAGDKVIQCFAVVNCLLLVGVVIYIIVDEPEPSDPCNPVTDIFPSDNDTTCGAVDIRGALGLTSSLAILVSLMGL